MPKCLNKIINENIAAGGIKNATDINVSNKGNGNQILFNSFTDALEGATLKLQRTNCTDVVMDYFSNQFPMTSGAVRGGYDWVSDNVNLQRGMQKFAGALDKTSNSIGFDAESITSAFCVTIINAFRSIIFYVDTTSKAAFVLFKKIDALKRKLEKALLDFTSEVRDCIVSVIVDAKIAINKLINNITDFDILIELMEKCPCIQDIISKMFNCEVDEYGNKFTSASQIVNCVTNKYSINPDSILNAVNDFVDNSILDNIDRGFNRLDQFIKTTMDLLMSPLRELMRIYCVLLNEKINITPIVKTLGSSECLLLYTIEKNANGKEYFGMSVIDMINTFKYWANCFEFVCSSFVEDLRTKVKELNEDLRLDDKYWRDVMFIDLYQSCVGQSVQSQQPRAAMIREIFVKNQDKGKNIFIGIIDAFKQTGKLDTNKNPKIKNPSPIADAIQFKDGPDNEDLPIQQGDELFKHSSIEENIISIIRNISTSVDKGIYFERFLQLIEWEARYKKTNQHIQLIESTDRKSKEGISNSITTREVSTVFDETSTERTVDAFNISNNPPMQSFKTPIYKLDNDYNDEDIRKIRSHTKPNKLGNESLQSQYTRWYREALA